MPDRNDDPLLKVAERVSDGNPVDWEAARKLQGEGFEDLEQLRLLSAVADAHRKVMPHRTAPEPVPSSRRPRSPWLWLASALAAALAALAGWVAYTRIFE